LTFRFVVGFLLVAITQKPETTDHGITPQKKED
jgi:hypothetical protein